MIANRPPVDAQSDVCDDNDTYVSCIYLYMHESAVAHSSMMDGSGK